MPRLPIACSGAAFSLTVAAALALAAPALARVADEKAERIAADRIALTWKGRAPVDVYIADRADAEISGAMLVSKANRQGRLESPAAATARPYFLLRDSQDGSVARVAERVLPLQQGSNFRDIGGYPAADGRHVKWGVLFRSGGTPLLNDSDLGTIRALGLADQVDLRSSEERVLAPTRIEGIRYQAVGYAMARITGGPGSPTDDKRMSSAYLNMPDHLAGPLRVLFRTLLQADGPVVYNCSAGQDRTGFATALILTALGVPRDTIYADYHLSTTYRHPEWELPKLDLAQQAPNSTGAYFAAIQSDPKRSLPRPLYDAEHRPLLEAALVAVERRWGSVDAYLAKEIGVGPAEMMKLRATYLE